MISVNYTRSDDSQTKLITLSENEFLVDGTEDMIVHFSNSVNGQFAELTFYTTSLGAFACRAN